MVEKRKFRWRRFAAKRNRVGARRRAPPTASGRFRRSLSGPQDRGRVRHRVLLLIPAPLSVSRSHGDQAPRRAARRSTAGPVVHGRTFTIYKIADGSHCEKVSGPRWSTPGDPRITGVGRLLRKTHLDELPQLFNVLKGDMGLIGPRPERPEFIEDLQQEFPTYPDRLLVRPGVTGLAQVQLPADTGLVSVRRKLTYDLYYIRTLNAWLDARILFATVFKAAGVPYRLVRQLSALPGSHIIGRAVRPRRVRPSLDDRAQWAA